MNVPLPAWDRKPSDTYETAYRICTRCAILWHFIQGREYRRSPCCGKALQ